MKRSVYMVSAVLGLALLLGGCAPSEEQQREKCLAIENEVNAMAPALREMDGKIVVEVAGQQQETSVTSSHWLLDEDNWASVNEVAGLIDYSMDDFDIACIPAVDKGTVLVASKASGITSVEDLVEKAKAAPGEITYASELGGYSHLQGLILMDEAGIDLKILDIGSASDKITNMLGGRVDLAAISYGAVKDYAETGDLVILAQYNEERNENLDPDIPTFAECGIDFVMEKPYIIAFPKGTDQAIIDKINEVAAQIAEDPEYQNALIEGYNQPAEYIAHDDALELLSQTREEYMAYQDLLQ